MLEKNSPTPLYEQLANIIEDWIESGVILEGKAIPSELELSSRYKISRMTARKAVDQLVIKGLVFRRSGKGTFVSIEKVPYAPYSLRSFAQTMEKSGKKVTTKVLDRRIIQATKQIASNLLIHPNDEVVYLNRLRFVNSTPMAINDAYLPYPKFSSVLDIDLKHSSLTRIMEDILGETLSYSEDIIEASVANQREAALLDIEINAPVILFYGVSFMQDGTPIRSIKSRYRGDQFRFIISYKEGIMHDINT